MWRASLRLPRAWPAWVARGEMGLGHLPGQCPGICRSTDREVERLPTEVTKAVEEAEVTVED